MSMLSFIKEAGEKLFGKGQAQTAMAAAQADPSSTDKQKAANDAAADAILAYIDSQGLKGTGLTVTFDGSTATVYGVADSQATKEKIILCCGNVQGVAAVNDQMTVDQSAPEAQYYTVVKGDNLSKISRQCYGDPNKYTKIFEANKPMLKSPDLIYPGQVLRIPPAQAAPN